MIFLIGSIILSSYLTIAFKLCDRFGIDKFQAIVFNYMACALTGCVVSGSIPSFSESVSSPWFVWALLMGAAFIIIFNLIALTVQKAGLAVASVASKLSLIIPFVFSIFFYNDHAIPMKIVGVVLALVAVVLTLYPHATPVDQGTNKKSSFNLQVVVLPFIVFVTTGLLDTLIKYVEQYFITPANNDQYLITSFSAAFLLGLLYLGFLLVSGRTKLSAKAFAAGVLIGIPNYFSIWCLMKVLKEYSTISSVIIPVNNLGIVLFSSIVAWLFFKERLGRINWVGIALAIVAIALIAFGKEI